MTQKIEENLVYKNIKAVELEGLDRIFEGCTFLKCDFSYANLSHITFINCMMDSCNLSLVKLTNTGIQNVEFIDCKITGVNFGDCSNFSLAVNFTNCMMDYTIWHKKKIKATKFINCALDEADFSETDLTNVLFQKCNLNRTIFNRSILKGADFSTAYNFNIDPENNTLAKAKFSAETLSGLLMKYNLIIE